MSEQRHPQLSRFDRPARPAVPFAPGSYEEKMYERCNGVLCLFPRYQSQCNILEGYGMTEKVFPNGKDTWERWCAHGKKESLINDARNVLKTIPGQSHERARQFFNTYLERSIAEHEFFAAITDEVYDTMPFDHHDMLCRIIHPSESGWGPGIY